MNRQLKAVKGTLKETLKDWDDWDVAQYKLGISLGLFQEDNGSYDFFRENKYLFWSDHLIGKFLHNTLEEMLKLNILEFNDEEQQYRCVQDQNKNNT